MKIDCPPIGAVLIRQGFCSAMAVVRAVEKKTAGDDRPLGEVLCEETGLSRDALEVAYVEAAFFPAVAKLLLGELAGSKMLRARGISLGDAGEDGIRIFPLAWQVKAVAERQFRRAPGGEILAKSVSYLSAISGTAVPVARLGGAAIKGGVFPFVFNLRTKDLDLNLDEIASDLTFKLVQAKLKKAEAA